MGQSALPEGTAAHRPPPRPSWKIRLDRSLRLTFQTSREPQIGRRKPKKPFGGTRQEAFASAKPSQKRTRKIVRVQAVREEKSPVHRRIKAINEPGRPAARERS